MNLRFKAATKCPSSKNYKSQGWAHWQFEIKCEFCEKSKSVGRSYTAARLLTSPRANPVRLYEGPRLIPDYSLHCTQPHQHHVSNISPSCLFPWPYLHFISSLHHHQSSYIDPQGPINSSRGSDGQFLPKIFNI